jgi:hypothetical protein
VSKKRSHKKTGRRYGASYWLERELRKKHFREARQRDFEDAVSEPSMYELRNRASGHGMPVDLGDVRHGVFWSKGWKGCHMNCGRRVDDWDAPMYDTVEVQDGVRVWRRSCRKPNHLEEE